MAPVSRALRAGRPWLKRYERVADLLELAIELHDAVVTGLEDFRRFVAALAAGTSQE